MRRKLILKLLREARRHATLEFAEFGSISRGQVKSEPPVKMANGSIVTESNVTEFIRERIRLHHETWVIGPIDDVIEEIERV